MSANKFLVEIHKGSFVRTCIDKYINTKFYIPVGYTDLNLNFINLELLYCVSKTTRPSSQGSDGSLNGLLKHTSTVLTSTVGIRVHNSTKCCLTRYNRVNKYMYYHFPSYFKIA